MTRRKYLVFGSACLILLGTLGGCGNPGNPDAYQDDGSNNCSDQFVDDYDTVADAIKDAKHSGDQDDFERAQSLVEDFAAQYQNVSCQAGIEDDYHLGSGPGIITANDQVNEWNSDLAEIQARAETADLLDRGVTLQILDPQMFNSVANSVSSMYFQKGQIVTTANLDASSNFCSLVFSDARIGADYQTGQEITFTMNLDTSTNRLIGTSQDRSLSLNCFNSTHNWKYHDLSEIFGQVATVLPTRNQ